MTLTTTDQNPADLIIPPEATGNRKSRLGLFAAWLAETGRAWDRPDLAAYRDHCLQARGYAAASTATHLATVRGRYRELLRDDEIRDLFWDRAGAAVARIGQADDPANRKAFVDEALTRLQNAIDPRAAVVETVTEQDREDEAGRRLTRSQADALLASPGVTTLRGLRDTAILALLLCTGLREGELSALDVDDLRCHLDGRLALRVREGKGRKKRLIPYGAQEWALVYVGRWLEAAGIEGGAVFRGFYKGNQSLRDGRLKPRQIQNVIKGYEVCIDGAPVGVAPHDLRRTYARLAHDAGMSIEAIQQNLGHADIKTTLGYIGVLDGEQRETPAIYTPPHWRELGVGC